jgi:hypothetical protein
LVGRPERKRPQGRSICRWQDNIKWILEKWDGMVWTGFIWLRIQISGGTLVNTVMKLRIP